MNGVKTDNRSKSSLIQALNETLSAGNDIPDVPKHRYDKDTGTFYNLDNTDRVSARDALDYFRSSVLIFRSSAKSAQTQQGALEFEKKAAYCEIAAEALSRMMK